MVGVVRVETVVMGAVVVVEGMVVMVVAEVGRREVTEAEETERLGRMER